MIGIAVKNIWDRKAKLTAEDIKKTQNHDYFKPYDNQVPSKYGRVIKGNDYAIEIQKELSSSLRKFKNETDPVHYKKHKTDKFGISYKVDRINFSEPRSNTNYYCKTEYWLNNPFHSHTHICSFGLLI